GWNERTMGARMGGEPRFNGRMGVGAVVVEDEMHLSPPRDRAIEPGQEGEELAVTFARMTLRQHGAVQNVQCREQRRRAVAGVIVRLGRWSSSAQRQKPVGGGRRLDFAGLICT